MGIGIQAGARGQVNPSNGAGQPAQLQDSLGGLIGQMQAALTGAVNKGASDLDKAMKSFSGMNDIMRTVGAPNPFSAGAGQTVPEGGKMGPAPQAPSNQERMMRLMHHVIR